MSFVSWVGVQRTRAPSGSTQDANVGSSIGGSRGRGTYGARRAYTGKRVTYTPEDDPHLVAGVIKSWLCELDSPLLTHELHSIFMTARGTWWWWCGAATTAAGAAGTAGADDVWLLPALQSPTASTPRSAGCTRSSKSYRQPTDTCSIAWCRCYRSYVSRCGIAWATRARVLTIRVLSLSLAQVAEHSSVNEMTPTNLAIVFAPIVMRYNTTDLQQLLKLSEWENEVLELCIRHYHIVFEDASSVRANAIAANFEEELRQGGILLAKSLLQKVRSFALVDRRSLRLVSLSLSLSLTIVMRAPSTVSNKQWPRSRPRLSPLAPSVYSLRYEQLASLSLSHHLTTKQYLLHTLLLAATDYEARVYAPKGHQQHQVLGQCRG